MYKAGDKVILFPTKYWASNALPMGVYILEQRMSTSGWHLKGCFYYCYDEKYFRPNNSLSIVLYQKELTQCLNLATKS